MRSNAIKKITRASLELTQNQKDRMEERNFHIRWALIENLHGERFEFACECPKCNHLLTEWEITKNYGKNDDDCLIHCGYKCKAALLRFNNGLMFQLPFYGVNKVFAELHQFIEKQPFRLDKLNEENPALYYSAVIYFGSLRSALLMIRENARQCPPPTENWQTKAEPFFSRLSDITIAKCVGIPPFDVRTARRKAGIRAYDYRKLVYKIKSEPS